MPITPADDWLIQVEARDGTNGRTYGPNQDADILAADGTILENAADIIVAHFDDLRWTTTTNGDSLDATWIAGAGSPVELNPNEPIIIYTAGSLPGEDPTRHYGRFFGEIIEPPNRNLPGSRPQPMRAIGVKQSLYRTDTEFPIRVPPGEDVADAAALGLAETSMPFQMNRPVVGSIPDTGIIMTAASTPGGASAAQWMDGLMTWAEEAGVRIVWGINPAAQPPAIFIEVPNAAYLELDARTAGVEIEWRTPQAQDVVEQIRWIIANGTTELPFYQPGVRIDIDAPDPLTHLSSSGIVNSWEGPKTLPLSPSEGHRPMRPVPNAVYSIAKDHSSGRRTSWDGGTQDASFTMSRVHDGSDITYISLGAENWGGILPVPPYYDNYSVTLKIKLPDDDIYTTDEIVAISLTASFDGDQSPDRDAALAGEFNATLLVTLDGDDDQTLLAAYYSDPQEHFIVQGDRARGVSVEPISHIRNGIEVTLTQRVEVTDNNNLPDIRIGIEDFRAWYLDKAHLDAAAKQEYRHAQADAASISVAGMQPDVGEIDLTRKDGLTLLALPVDTITRQYHHRQGARTIYTVGPRTDPATTEAMALVKDRDRRTLTSAKRSINEEPWRK